MCIRTKRTLFFFFFIYFYFPSFCCRQVFPNGLPEEYSLVATFRVRRNTKKERWYIWQILNQHDTPEVRVVFVFVFFNYYFIFFSPRNMINITLWMFYH